MNYSLLYKKTLYIVLRMIKNYNMVLFRIAIEVK